MEKAGAGGLFELMDPPGIIVNRLKGDPAEQRAHAALAYRATLDLDACLVGVPFDGASSVRTGSRHGPDAVRAALGYFTTYSGESRKRFGDRLRTADIGDIKTVLTDMKGSFSNVTTVMRTLFERNIVPVTIGGDHSVSWPILEGLCTAKGGQRVGIVHFDAHHDLREAHFGFESSGVPFRKALNFEGSPIKGWNMTQIGIAEFCNNPEHHDYAIEEGVTVVTNTAVRRNGLLGYVKEALDRACDQTDAVYVSLDIDAIDQTQAPGTASPNPNGLDARDLAIALYDLGRCPRVAGFDIVEISPPFDLNNTTALTAAILVLHFLRGVAERHTV
ncbi:agmatinase family protein [Paraburkholderia sp. CNPSo 3274]|uniref:agmatinase family protein n=1 Tax=unclassified Paraburkholderia TaxID=2615204 RepID=UPI0020B70E93|nr:MULTISPECIES: agmatinase family protein [unclassified Paraburkholderia]MCP3712365.1 agmatinase family protein [Paraburkholderia sp. CNPSo 3274]MCP3720517.1 agmatinase family protein [Paraburkholderia sp. CNPSo 3281]